MLSAGKAGKYFAKGGKIRIPALAFRGSCSSVQSSPPSVRAYTGAHENARDRRRPPRSRLVFVSCAGGAAPARRPLLRLLGRDRLLADGRAVQARDGRRGSDREGLLLLGLRLLRRRARRHAPRCADPFRGRQADRGSDPARESRRARGKGRRHGECGVESRLPRLSR